MSSSKSLAGFYISICLLAFSCSKKVEPETTLNRGVKSPASNQTSSDTSFNQGLDDFSNLGNPLRQDLGNPDLLSPRDESLLSFADEDNVIRPFEPVFFGFDQYNISAEERPKVQEIAQEKMCLF